MRLDSVKYMAAVAVMSGLVLAGAPALADNATLGTLGGAAAGGLIGSQFGHGGGNVAATVGGVVAGGVIGNAIGRDADRRSYHHHRHVVYVIHRPRPRVVYYHTYYRPWHPYRYYSY